LDLVDAAALYAGDVAKSRPQKYLASSNGCPINIDPTALSSRITTLPLVWCEKTSVHRGLLSSRRDSSNGSKGPVNLGSRPRGGASRNRQDGGERPPSLDAALLAGFGNDLGWKAIPIATNTRDQSRQLTSACVAKGGRSRRVPLWWDAGTLADLVAWRAERVAQGGRDADPFICSVQAHRRGHPLQRHALRRRFVTACKVLGRERLRMLIIDHGRHTFIYHAPAGGGTLAEVRDAAGHRRVLVTGVYLHVAV
jgi:hypothetical protein